MEDSESNDVWIQFTFNILVVYTLLHPSIGIVEGNDGVINKTVCQGLSSAQAEIKTDGNKKCV